MQNKSPKIFESNKFTAENLENQLWEILTQVRSKKMKCNEANSVISAAKEICNLARLRLQYKLLEGADQQSLVKK